MKDFSVSLGSHTREFNIIGVILVAPIMCFFLSICFLISIPFGYRAK